MTTFLAQISLMIVEGILNAVPRLPLCYTDLPNVRGAIVRNAAQVMSHHKSKEKPGSLVTGVKEQTRSLVNGVVAKGQVLAMDSVFGVGMYVYYHL